MNTLVIDPVQSDTIVLSKILLEARMKYLIKLAEAHLKKNELKQAEHTFGRAAEIKEML